jgi:cell division initiation protein
MFKRAFRGYDPSEVDQWIHEAELQMQKAAETIEQLVAEKDELQEEVNRQSAELERTRRNDRSGDEALIAAQRTADEIRSAAQKRAETILEEARQDAAEQIAAAQLAVQKLEDDVKRLRAERQRYLDDSRLNIEKHLQWLDIVAFGEES